MCIRDFLELFKEHFTHFLTRIHQCVTDWQSEFLDCSSVLWSWSTNPPPALSASLSSEKFAYIFCYTPAMWATISQLLQKCHSSVTPACVLGLREVCFHLTLSFLMSLMCPSLCILCLWPLSTSTWLKCGLKCLFPMDLILKLFSFQLDYVSIDTEKDFCCPHGSLKKTKLGTSRLQKQKLFLFHY